MEKNKKYIIKKCDFDTFRVIGEIYYADKVQFEIVNEDESFFYLRPQLTKENISKIENFIYDTNKETWKYNYPGVEIKVSVEAGIIVVSREEFNKLFEEVKETKYNKE